MVIEVEAMVSALMRGKYLVIADQREGPTVRRDVERPSTRGLWAVSFCRSPGAVRARRYDVPPEPAPGRRRGRIAR